MEYYGFNKKIKPKKGAEEEDLSLFQLLFGIVRFVIALFVFLFGLYHLTVMAIASIFALYLSERDWTANYFLGGLIVLVVVFLAFLVLCYISIFLSPLETNKSFKALLNEILSD